LTQAYYNWWELRTAKRFFLNSFNDLSAHVISGSYHITPGELDQFGEFAVVQPVPEPGTLLLFWIGLGVVWLKATKYKTMWHGLRPQTV
jgi:hypothetical protein